MRLTMKYDTETRAYWLYLDNTRVTKSQTPRNEQYVTAWTALLSKQAELGDTVKTYEFFEQHPEEAQRAGFSVSRQAVGK